MLFEPREIVMVVNLIDYPCTQDLDNAIADPVPASVRITPNRGATSISRPRPALCSSALNRSIRQHGLIPAANVITDAGRADQILVSDDAADRNPVPFVM
jgi:hypothetical protein